MKIFKRVILFFLQASVFYSTGNACSVPEFINHVPPGHYAGVSIPCTDLQKARNSAISDVARQVLGSINSEYNYSYTSTVSGNPGKPKILIRDDFSAIASGTVLDVEKNILRSTYCTDESGKLISFILVRYSEFQIEKMRRLSKGGNVVASILSESGGVLRVKITETNGVAVTLASADISVLKQNRFAEIINFCIWKVPYGSRNSFTRAFGPVKICGDTSIEEIDIRRAQKTWKDRFLGAHINFEIILKGLDEIGRDVFVDVIF